MQCLHFRTLPDVCINLNESTPGNCFAACPVSVSALSRGHGALLLLLIQSYDLVICADLVRGNPCTPPAVITYERGACFVGLI